MLELAEDNPLLHAVVSATHGADTELLPLLTTHAHSLLGVAKAVIGERLVPYDLALDPAHLDAAIDMVVRVVLSHVMQPSARRPAPPTTSPGWPQRVLGRTSDPSGAAPVRASSGHGGGPSLSR